ncbi:MAG: hypothetical protein ACXWZF_04325 [Actinomycetota bacterium]
MTDVAVSTERTPGGRAATALAEPSILRLASSIASAVITGIVVGGLGTRLVMRLSAMAADDSRIGLITENGNRVGDITGEGTIALIMFVGLATGPRWGCSCSPVAPCSPAASCRCRCPSRCSRSAARR